MEDEHSAPHTTAPSLVERVAWLMVAVIVLLVWTTFGFFLLMPLENLAPAQGPEQAPPWLVYVGLVYVAAVWPLLLLLITRRQRALNGSLMVLYLAGAGAVVFGGELVVLGRTLHDPLQKAPAAVLLVTAVALYGLWSRRTRQTAKW